jgi:hypothetical protein
MFQNKIVAPAVCTFYVIHHILVKTFFIYFVAYLPHARKVESQKQPFLSSTSTMGYATHF